MKTEYMVVMCADSEHMGTLVTKKLAEGWLLHGSMSVCQNRVNMPLLFQPMVRFTQEHGL